MFAIVVFGAEQVPGGGANVELGVGGSQGCGGWRRVAMPTARSKLTVTVALMESAMPGTSLRHLVPGQQSMMIFTAY